MKDTKTRRQLTPKERVALSVELFLPPTNFGFVEEAWSGHLLSRYLRISRGIDVGARQCRRLLNDLGLPRRHPITPRCVDPQIPGAAPREVTELPSSRRSPMPSALRKESVLGQVRRLASSGLPLYPFIQTLFDLIGEAIPTGDLPKGLWTDARVSSSWVFANLDVGKWFPVLANSGDLGQIEAWPGLRPRRELNRTNPVLTLGEFTAPDYRHSLIYNEFFRPLKLEQGLLLQLTDHNDLVGYYPIYRSAAMRPFGRDEIAFLAKAAPHIAHGIKVAKLINAQTLTDTAAMPVACEPGVVVMDSTGRPIALDAQARSLFFQAGLCDGITMTPYTEAHWRRLLEYIARSLRAIFQQNMNSNGDIDAPAAQIVSFRAGITLRLRGYVTAGASASSPFVVLVEQIEPEEFYNRRIMYRHGLSPREVEVLTFVRNNLPTGRIAAELGISLVTVKTYIRQIIAKLEVENLSALRVFGLNLVKAQISAK